MVRAVNSSAGSEQKKITRRAGVVALGTLFSRLLGIGRDIVLAATFSRGATDAFLVAFQLPNLLRQLLAEGAVQTAVLPVLTQVKEQKGEAEAQRYFRALRGLSLCVLTLVTLLGIYFAPQLINLFAPGFKSRPEQWQETVTLTQLVFPYIFFMGTAALGIAALNTQGRFVVTSFAPALLNVSFILFALTLPAFLGERGYPLIFSMAVGALVGGFLQVIAQWPSLRKTGYGQLPSLAWHHPAIRETLRRIAPTLFGIGIYYVDVILARRLLSELGEGPISYFGFALRICDFPQGIFVMALQTATLPSLASFVARKDFLELGRTFAFSMRLALYVGLAATVLFVLLAEPIVSLIFQRGSFSAHDTRETAQALRAQGVGIFLVAGIRQLVAVFFALGDTKTPVLVAALDLCVFIGGALLFRELWGHAGVGLAVSLASLAQFLLLGFFLRRRLQQLFVREIFRSALHSLGLALVSGGATWGLVQLLGITQEDSALLRSLPALLGSAFFIVVFIGLSWLTQSAEFLAILEPFKTRLRRKRAL